MRSGRRRGEKRSSRNRWRKLRPLSLQKSSRRRNRGQRRRRESQTYRQPWSSSEVGVWWSKPHSHPIAAGYIPPSLPLIVFVSPSFPLSNLFLPPSLPTPLPHSFPISLPPPLSLHAVSGGSSIDRMNPSTPEEFDAFQQALVKKITSYEVRRSPHIN